MDTFSKTALYAEWTDLPSLVAQAVALANNLGFISCCVPEQGELLRVLRHLHTSLKPGGQVLLEMAGKEPLARMFQPRTWQRHAERDEYLLQERIIQEGWRWLENHWIWIGGPAQKVFIFRLRLYSGAELTDLLRTAGFSAVQLYGSLAGTPYDHTAQRLVAVATK